jgi:hypothetical protein
VSLAATEITGYTDEVVKETIDTVVVKAAAGTESEDFEERAVTWTTGDGGSWVLRSIAPHVI